MRLLKGNGGSLGWPWPGPAMANARTHARTGASRNVETRTTTPQRWCVGGVEKSSSSATEGVKPSIPDPSSSSLPSSPSLLIRVIARCARARVRDRERIRREEKQPRCCVVYGLLACRGARERPSKRATLISGLLLQLQHKASQPASQTAPRLIAPAAWLYVPTLWNQYVSTAARVR